MSVSNLAGQAVSSRMGVVSDIQANQEKIATCSQQPHTRTRNGVLKECGTWHRSLPSSAMGGSRLNVGQNQRAAGEGPDDFEDVNEWRPLRLRGLRYGLQGPPLLVAC